MWEAIYKAMDDMERDCKIDTVQFYMRGENLYNAPSIVIWYKITGSGYLWCESLGYA